MNSSQATTVWVIKPYLQSGPDCHVLTCAGRGQQQALVLQLWQEPSPFVSWSQPWIRITCPPSTIPRVPWRGKVLTLAFSSTLKPTPKTWSDSWALPSRAGPTWSRGGHVSSLALSGTGSRRREAAGWRWCWSSPVPVHPHHRGGFTHAVQLHVPLVVPGTRGTARELAVFHCNSSARQWPRWTCPPYSPQPCGHQSGWLDETDGRLCPDVDVGEAFSFHFVVPNGVHSSQFIPCQSPVTPTLSSSRPTSCHWWRNWERGQKVCCWRRSGWRRRQVILLKQSWRYSRSSWCWWRTSTLSTPSSSPLLIVIGKAVLHPYGELFSHLVFIFLWTIKWFHCS